MPKRSKEELHLSKKIYPFLLEREHTSKTYNILQKLLSSLLKAKSSHRRKQYRDRLDTMLQNLAVQSEDLVIQKEKNKSLQQKYEYIQAKYSKLLNDDIKKQNWNGFKFCGSLPRIPECLLK